MTDETAIAVGTRDSPSMGDAEFVDALVRLMLDEARLMLLAGKPGSNPKELIVKLAHEWRDKLWAGNAEYIQTMTPEAQNVWLQSRGLGVGDPDEKAGVGALVVATLGLFVDTVLAHVAGEIDAEQTQFRIDSDVEDCVALLRGLDNPAD